MKTINILLFCNGGGGSGGGKVGDTFPVPIYASVKTVYGLIRDFKKSPEYLDAMKENILRGESIKDPGVKNPDGTYTLEAEKENNKIASLMLNEKAIVKKGKPTAILMLGPPGSGKTTILNRLQVEGKLPKNVTIIDPDYAKSQLKGFKPILAPSYHERSSDIAKKANRMAVDKKMNIVYDSTGVNSESFLRKVQHFKDEGYNVTIVQSKVSNSTSVSRAIGRFKRGGRFVPAEIMYTKGQDKLIDKTYKQAIKISGSTNNWRFDSNGEKARQIR